MNSIGFTTNGQLSINGVPRSFSSHNAYNLISGGMSLTNSVITAGMATTLYTGNGTTQSVVTGVDMTTQWGNSASETFGGLVWLKSRSNILDNVFTDTTRGATKQVYSNQTALEVTDATRITTFNADGFSLGASALTNTNLATYASWNFQTTHRITGTTNHGKTYTCHYNPFTGFTMVKYEGSGLAGHEIPHHLGRKLGFVTIKNLSAITEWRTHFNEVDRIILNLISAKATDAFTVGLTDSTVTFNSSTGVTADWNGASNQHIMYGWANSYFDVSNTLIGNYEVGVYQGTGAAGNKVTTRGKPAWVMTKRLDATGNWIILDNKRNNISGLNDGELYPNLSNAESAGFSIVTFLEDGFSLQDTSGDRNISGGQYLYMVVYDNDSGSGKSKYNKATDTSALSLTATVPFANGVDTNGTKNTVLTKNETVTGLTLTQGKNYVYAKNDGLYGVKAQAPQYGSYNGFGDYFDAKSNQWYQSPSVFNNDGSTTIGWTTTNGTLTSINGELVAVVTTAAHDIRSPVISTIIGKKYRVLFTNTSSNLTSSRTRVFDGTVFTYDKTYSSGSNVVIDIVASSTTTYLFLLSDSGYTGTASFDNIAIYPINDDGSVDITSATPITESRNYLDAIVYADAGGQPTFVEQLPKTRYEDTMQVNSLNVLGGFDLNQKWYNVLSNRVLNATYYNTTGKMKKVMVRINVLGGSSYLYGMVDGVYVGLSGNAADIETMYTSIYFDVPPNSKYIVTALGSFTLIDWSELY